MEPHEVDHIVIHCTAGSADATLEDIRRAHVEGRGWSDIGYHFLVWQDGRVSSARSMWRDGAHALGFNDRSFGLAWVGHHDHYPPSHEAWEEMCELVATLAVAYEVRVSDVLGHRETYDERGQRRLKTCPGRLVDMDVFRADVAERLVRMHRPDLARTAQA